MKKFGTAIWRLFKPNATDENWEYFGEKCPYFGVVTSKQYQPENFNEQARQEFFQTGQQYVSWLMDFIRQKIKPDFQPKNSIDFGCGVGRLLIPIAGQSVAATGIEISPSMMEEAKANCRRFGVANAQFVKTAEELAAAQGRFDFIHSFIVFQHIPPDRGYEIFRQLLALLQEGGVGALHFTYCNPCGRRERCLNMIYRRMPILFAVKNLLTEGPGLNPGWK